MGKDEFLRRLDSLLQRIPERDRRDMLYDYEEHIRVAMEKGVSEEEAVRGLGSPRSIAKELMADYYVQQADETASVTNVTRAVLATISLGFFNLVFVSGPFFAAVGILIAFFAVSISFILLPIKIIFGITFLHLILPFGLFSSVSTTVSVFTLLLLEGLGLVFLAGTILLAKWFGILFVTYLKFNLRVIKGGN
ncbi:HAAS domain-containing protein [Alicyclobacillus sp. SO9]|uniref:HAAS signaling domain-containing protein n=1 Tax=Alicyclobacillus sp. SO9 TaxID=2665646 RepID=UPI0018E812CF|nr:DUF1700 domain-containing protein [Alicyclobacillus sp. SO9]QQE80206.1 DUF1700 domain-containing protein [Alicyclobacillus sp. SO9]